jgi:hypothetical protein
MTMRKAVRSALHFSLAVAALTLAAPDSAHAGDWGFRFSGDLGAAPASAASRFFDVSEKDFNYHSRGIELGVAYKDFDVSAFMYTVNKGYLNKDYAQKSCGPWGTGAENICASQGTLPEGTYIDPTGMRMFGVKAGGFLTLWRPSKLFRVGVPVHVAAVLDSGHANQTVYKVSLQPVAGGLGLSSTPTTTKIKGSTIFKGDMNPYPIVDVGIGFKFRSASWAEIEVFLKADNPRFPVFAWGMTFRKHSK